MGIFSYASTILSGIGFGFVAQQWGWNAAYATILFAALVGVVVLMLMWPLGSVAGRIRVRKYTLIQVALELLGVV